MKQRPWWMTGFAVFCAVTAAFNALRDLFGAPEYRDVEVWFGFEVVGTVARVSAPLHWAFFVFGAWAFWTCKPWIMRLAAGYVVYVAVSHIVWSETSPVGDGWRVGLLHASGISGLGLLLLWLAHRANEKLRP